MYKRMPEPGMENKDSELPPDQQQPPPYPEPTMEQPPPMVNYPPQQGGYPPQQGGYPPQQGGYPQQPFYPASHMSSSSNTTVVVQQPQTQVVVQGPRAWTTGLCSCFEDCGVCLLGCFCPCILECMVSTAAGECCCVASVCPIALRTKIRTRHNIQGSVVDDCCTLMCCRMCALCQMQREVNIHGI